MKIFEGKKMNDVDFKHLKLLEVEVEREMSEM